MHPEQTAPGHQVGQQRLLDLHQGRGGARRHRVADVDHQQLRVPLRAQRLLHRLRHLDPVAGGGEQLGQPAGRLGERVPGVGVRPGPADDHDLGHGHHHRGPVTGSS